MSNDLDVQFLKAKDDVLHLSKAPANEVKLKLYGLFKQATEGDYTHGKKPGVLDLPGKFKYEAWKMNEGMSADDAKFKYVELVRDLQTADTNS